jgi:hypothetical protein
LAKSSKSHWIVFFFGNIYRKTPYFLGKKTRFPVKLFQTRPTHHPNHIQKQGHNLHLNCEHSKPGEPRGTLTGTLVGGKFGDGTANYTGWFIWIPLLGSVIPYNHQATRVLNTAKIHGMLRLKKNGQTIPGSEFYHDLPDEHHEIPRELGGIPWYTTLDKSMLVTGDGKPFAIHPTVSHSANFSQQKTWRKIWVFGTSHSCQVPQGVAQVPNFFLGRWEL